MRWTVMVAGLVAVESPSRADTHGGGFLHYELSGWTRIDDASGPGTEPSHEELVLAGIRLHGYAGPTARIQYHVGLDLAAGGTIRNGGFAYDVALFPIGVAVRLGASTVFGVGAGIGASGAVGTIDDAMTFPLEALTEIGIGPVRLLGRARVSFIYGDDARSREDGSEHAPLGDELEAMVALRVGKHDRRYRFAFGNGYFVGAAYREHAGAQFAGLTIGYSIDGATAPPQTPRDAFRASSSSGAPR